MDALIYTAMSGAEHSLRAQQVHANNLANLETGGFRADLELAHSQPVTIGYGYDDRHMSTMQANTVLQRGGTIEGSVRFPASVDSASGSSLEGLAVNVERKLGPNTYARVGGAAHTDAQGRYEISGLALGEYIVFVGMGANRGRCVELD